MATIAERVKQRRARTIAERVKRQRQVLTLADVERMVGPKLVARPRKPIKVAATPVKPKEPEACPTRILVGSETATDVVINQAHIQKAVATKAQRVFQKDPKEYMEEASTLASNVVTLQMALEDSSKVKRADVERAVLDNKNTLINVATEMVAVMDRIDTSHGDGKYYKALHSELEHMIKAYGVYTQTFDDFTAHGGTDKLSDVLDAFQTAMRHFCVTMDIILEKHPDALDAEAWGAVLKLYQGQVCDEFRKKAAREESIVAKTKKFMKSVVQFGRRPIVMWHRFVQSRLGTLVSHLWRRRILLLFTYSAIKYSNLSQVITTGKTLAVGSHAVIGGEDFATLGAPLMDFFFSVAVMACMVFANNALLARMFVRRVARVAAKIVMAFFPAQRVMSWMHDWGEAILGNAFVWVAPFTFWHMIEGVILGGIGVVCGILDKIPGTVEFVTQAVLFIVKAFKGQVSPGELLNMLVEKSAAGTDVLLEWSGKNMHNILSGARHYSDQLVKSLGAEDVVNYLSKRLKDDHVKVGVSNAFTSLWSVMPEPFQKAWGVAAAEAVEPNVSSEVITGLDIMSKNADEVIKNSKKLTYVYNTLNSLYMVVAGLLRQALDQLSFLRDNMFYFGYMMMFMLGVYDDLAPQQQKKEHDEHEKKVADDHEKLALENRKLRLEKELAALRSTGNPER